MTREEKQQLKAAKLFRRYGNTALYEIVEKNGSPKATLLYAEYCYAKRSVVLFICMAVFCLVMGVVSLFSASLVISVHLFLAVPWLLDAYVKSITVSQIEHLILYHLEEHGTA